ncbi:hypothetical protein [Celeribacter persicus]|uniref:Uncharacterized protein n=1 Tax=Celeribacter persicus TaxID=1651082 RepID=A0A2T5HK85_9RHOB|nr:hypothetical protein [Celeribacter persicus]PTQ71956.1 hypothetical protein C8N42_107135 [Celeribacter persicus]
MQIFSAHSLLAARGQTQNQTAVTNAETRGDSVADDPAANGSSEKTTAQSGAQHTGASGKSNAIQGAREIFARYDLTAISANEIDQLTAVLKAARFDDLGFVMGLERQGAAYRTDMENSGRVYGIGATEFDPDTPIDLLAQTRSELALASRYGQDTERLSTQLFKLEEAQMARPAATTTSATPQLAETLVLFQAQRLWIE